MGSHGFEASPIDHARQGTLPQHRLEIPALRLSLAGIGTCLPVAPAASPLARPIVSWPPARQVWMAMKPASPAI